jgi:hypothetical protein
MASEFPMLWVLWREIYAGPLQLTLSLSLPEAPPPAPSDQARLF